MSELFNLTDAAQSKIFRGLFYLWGIAFVVMFVKISGGLVMLLPPVSPDVWAMSSPEHLIYLPLVKYFLLFELASRTALLYVGGLVAFAFVRRRRNVSRWIMIFLVAYLGVLIVEESMTYIMIKQKYGWAVSSSKCNG